MSTSESKNVPDEVDYEMPDERVLHLECFESGDYDMMELYGPDRAKEMLMDLREYAEAHGMPCQHVKMLLYKLDKGLIKWKGTKP
ncbi:hypothetical protein niasHT_003266 [Heterodera trifolii]|uniref:Uncharacterized protein n=1 Tax=Heterodera trifolii TaxID=157864 RepID=A0ABD2L340_9BILA